MSIFMVTYIVWLFVETIYVIDVELACVEIFDGICMFVIFDETCMFVIDS